MAQTHTGTHARTCTSYLYPGSGSLAFPVASQGRGYSLNSVFMEHSLHFSFHWPFTETPRSIRKHQSSCHFPHKVCILFGFRPLLAASGLNGMRLSISHWENEAKQPGTLVAKRLVQACDMSSTSGLTQSFKFLSAGNFYQTIILPLLHPPFFSTQSISIHWLMSQLKVKTGPVGLPEVSLVISFVISWGYSIG